MNPLPAGHPIIPVQQDWLVALSEEEGTVEAFEATTLRPMFSGRYIAPKEYGKRDPRKWSDRQTKQLLKEYGLYGGSRINGAIFVLAEVVALRVLMQSVEKDEQRRLDQLTLVDALSVARDAYREYVMIQLHGLTVGGDADD